jgi:hypothetical protein
MNFAFLSAVLASVLAYQPAPVVDCKMSWQGSKLVKESVCVAFKKGNKKV